MGVLARARGLWQAALAGPAPLALRNRKIGLVCEAPDGLEAALLRQAATKLGAHVSALRPHLAADSTDAEVAATAPEARRFIIQAVLLDVLA